MAIIVRFLLRDWLILWVGTILLVFAILFAELHLADELFAPDPYNNVEVRSWVIENGELLMVANFIKNTCDPVALRAIGSAGGETSPLPWRDLDIWEQNDDRQAGVQTLRIGIDLGGVSWDWVEIRTTHACPVIENPRFKVDKVFARWTRQESRNG